MEIPTITSPIPVTAIPTAGIVKHLIMPDTTNTIPPAKRAIVVIQTTSTITERRINITILITSNKIPIGSQLGIVSINKKIDSQL